MNKAPPNLDLLYDKVLDFNEVHPDEYFDSVLYHLSDNTSQIHNIFDNLTSVFANNPSLLNALKIVLLFVIRLGAPAFFGLEGSRIPELNLDPITQHDELLELKRIMRYCLEKFQKMQTAHEIPNIRQKYAELCQIVQEEVPIGEIQLTDFEQQYSELAVKFKQFEQRMEALISESQDNNGNQIIFENSKGIQLLEQINELMIQPEQGFTKSENELILNFFHQKYALITRIYNEFPHIAQEYQKFREEKKAKRQQEKGEEEQKHTTPDSQIQNIKDFTFFVEGTSLAAFPESMNIEYKDYLYPFRNEELKKKLRATICAFLNTNGGRILIGVGNTGFRVKGLFLTTNDQDTLIRDIDALVKDFHPKVDPEEVTSTFIPIKKRDGTYKPGFYIVKILVKRGKPNDLYFAGRDCYKRRNGQNDVQMPGNFKRDILDRATVTIQTHPELFRDRGEFNDPAPELGIPITNVKEKRPSVEVKPVKPIGIKQKPSGQMPSATTKLLVKNVPNKPDIGIELKTILDPIQPLSKTLLFTKDNEVILTFQKIEDTKVFMDYVEGNPIAIGNNTLQFSPKPLDKEKQSEKAKMKVEVEEDKKDPLKAKAESSSIIWVRNIPENTTDLKEKLTAMLGEHAAKLKDIKIHNKKKRATLEFETSIQANEVLNYLNLTDRFIGEAKVTFEKASPPSSPQATKSTDIKPVDSTKAKETVKNVEQGKPQETKKQETVGGNQVVETNILKISNIPLDESGQELGYLVRSCNHHIKKAVEKKINKDHVLFYFKDKEDSVKAFNFLVQNNFSFRGKKIRVDYYSPPPQKTEASKPKNVKGQVNNAQTVVAPNVNNQEIIGQGQNIPQGGMIQSIDMTNQNNIPPGIYNNGIQQEMYSNDHLIQQHQQQPQFNPFVFQGNNGYHTDPHFYQDQSTAHFNNNQFDPNHQQGFGSTRLQQSGNTVDQLLRTTETLEPDSIQFDIQNTPNNPMSQQQIQPQHQYLPSQPQTGFDPKSLQQQQQQNVGDPQHSVMQTQQPNPNVQDQKNINQPNAQKTEAQQQQAFQPNENQNKEVVAPGLGQGFNPGHQQYVQPQFNQSNVHPIQQTTTPLQTQTQHNFVQDPKLLNQQNAYQYGQAPQTGGPQQSVPQGNNLVVGGGQGPSNTNVQGQIPDQANRTGVNNQIFQNHPVPPAYYSQFPQQQMSPQQINQQRGVQTNNPIQPNGQYSMNNPQQALNKNFPQTQNQYQQQGINTMQNNFPTNWQQNQPQGTQQQFPNYPMQQFNQGQQQYGQQNLGAQFQQMNQQGQFGGQQGQFPTQGGQFPGQTPQYPFQGGNQQTANLQGNKNIPNQQEAFGKKQQLPQNQLQGQNQLQTQGNIPSQQNFGGPSYYSGYPQGQMPGNFPYGQNVGYNQNQNMQNNLRPDMMYQNVQGNMQGNLQQAGGNQGLTPQQLQQLQMQQQQMQYGGLPSPQFVGTNNQINMK